MFLGQEETTEANGLEVSFNVKEEDISKFQINFDNKDELLSTLLKFKTKSINPG